MKTNFKLWIINGERPWHEYESEWDESLLLQEKTNFEGSFEYAKTISGKSYIYYCLYFEQKSN